MGRGDVKNRDAGDAILAFGTFYTVFSQLNAVPRLKAGSKLPILK